MPICCCLWRKVITSSNYIKTSSSYLYLYVSMHAQAQRPHFYAHQEAAITHYRPNALNRLVKTRCSFSFLPSFSLSYAVS